MINLKLSDLYRLNITPSLLNEKQLHLEGSKNVLTPGLVEKIRESKEDLIKELTDTCEHVNVVNLFSELKIK